MASLFWAKDAGTNWEDREVIEYKKRLIHSTPAESPMPPTGVQGTPATAPPTPTIYTTPVGAPLTPTIYTTPADPGVPPMVVLPHVPPQIPSTNLLQAGTHGHHPWPKYLGGPIEQILVNLPEYLHKKYHSGLDKILPRQLGTKTYEALSAKSKRAVLRALVTYTKAFDRAYGTKIYKAILNPVTCGVKVSVFAAFWARAGTAARSRTRPAISHARIVFDGRGISFSFMKKDRLA